MNTVKIGDKFEEKCKKLIVNAIKDEKFAFPLKYAQVIPKSKYYCKKREKDIIFDLAIEIWPPNAENYSNLYLIECKSYSTKKVPIGDLEKFQSNVNSVAELNGKAVFITDSSYTDTEIKLARNTGMMLIEVENEQSLNILLHKTNRTKFEKSNKLQSKQFENFIRNVFNPIEVKGLKKLSHTQLERKANELLNDFKPEVILNYKRYDLVELTEYVESKLNIKTLFSDLSHNSNQNQILGLFDNSSKTILIDNSIKETV